MLILPQVEPAAWENKRETYQVLRPGEMLKATSTLEAQIIFQPTLTLTNGLPSAMKARVGRVGRQGLLTGLQNLHKFYKYAS